MESMFDMWVRRELPVEWQRKVDAFAGQDFLSANTSPKSSGIWKSEKTAMHGADLVSICRPRKSSETASMEPVRAECHRSTWKHVGAREVRVLPAGFFENSGCLR